MLAKRIIPCLDVKDGRVVKGVNFVGLRDAGDPVEAAARYNEQGADELTFLDITATSDGRDLILPIIEAVASQVFIPLTVGGGVREVSDVRRLLNAGADQVALSPRPGAKGSCTCTTSGAKARIARARLRMVRGDIEICAVDPLDQVVKVRPTMCTCPCRPGTSPGASTRTSCPRSCKCLVSWRMWICTPPGASQL